MTTRSPKNAASPKKTEEAEDPSSVSPPWLAPIKKSQPCGPHLEYDPDYMILLSRLSPQTEVEYGDFVSTGEAPDWIDIEKECQRLLQRSKDIPLFLGLIRCRIHREGAVGLVQGMEMLCTTLEHYPEDIHPQKTLDGELDPEVRANALAALIDPDGVLDDLRNIVVDKSTTRLTVRDIERAFAIPTLPDALSAESVQKQMQHLWQKKQTEIQALTSAYEWVVRLNEWCNADLGDDAPDLRPLSNILVLFKVENNRINPQSQPRKSTSVSRTLSEEMPQMTDEDDSSPHAEPFHHDSMQQTQAAEPARRPVEREHALQYMVLAREWYEINEPSSPVGVLLKQAERLVGKRFTEVVQAVPTELMVLWDQDDSAPEQRPPSRSRHEDFDNDDHHDRDDDDDDDDHRRRF